MIDLEALREKARTVAWAYERQKAAHAKMLVRVRELCAAAEVECEDILVLADRRLFRELVVRLRTRNDPACDAAARLIELFFSWR